VKSSVNPMELLLRIVLTATTSLPSTDVDVVKQRILKEGIRVYVTNNIEAEMLQAMRLALARAEMERDQNRTRADHFQEQHALAQARVAVLEAELKDKRTTLGFLEQGLTRRMPQA